MCQTYVKKVLNVLKSFILVLKLYRCAEKIAKIFKEFYSHMLKTFVFGTFSAKKLFLTHLEHFQRINFRLNLHLRIFNRAKSSLQFVVLKTQCCQHSQHSPVYFEEHIQSTNLTFCAPNLNIIFS